MTELKSVGLSNQADTAGRVAYHVAFSSARRGLESVSCGDAFEAWWANVVQASSEPYKADAQAIFVAAYDEESELFYDEHEWAWRRLATSLAAID